MTLKKKEGPIGALLNRLPPVFKKAIIRSICLPISSGAFLATVFMLRLIGFLRRPGPRIDGQVNQILVSYPYGNLGDLVLTLPMIEALHAEWPKAIIDVVVRARTADLLSGISYVRKVYQFPNREAWIRETTNYLRVLDAVSLYRKQLMSQDYDLAISARWGDDPSYGSYLMYLTGAPRRCGYSAGVAGGDLGMDRLLTNVAAGGHHEQEALRILRLLNRSGVRSEKPSDDAVVTAPIALLQESAKAQTENLTGPLLDAIQSKYIVIAPGAMVPRKLWPAEKFIECMEHLQHCDDFTFIVVGSSEETARCVKLAEYFPGRAISLAGKTTLGQLIAVLANAALFIGNDSGPAHIAGALGIPTVVVHLFPSSCNLEHNSSSLRFRPCGPRVAIVQPEHPMPPCDTCCEMEEPHCIQQVSVKQVLDAVDRLIPSRDGIPIAPFVGGSSDL